MGLVSSTQRIVFIDVDGTIVDHGADLASSTVDAIRATRANGHLVFICTGRSAGDVFPHVRDIGFDGEITNSGALAIHDGAVIADHVMSGDDVDRLQGFFEQHGIDYFLQTNDAVYASAGAGERINASFHEAHRRSTGDDDSTHNQDPVVRFRPLTDDVPDDIAKAVFMSADPTHLRQAQDALGDRFHVIPGSIPLPGGSAGEIGLHGVNKGSAIDEVLAALDLDRTAAVGIGDSWNDAEMFDVVGTAVAMEGTDPELAARADFVTTGIHDDGVANALDRLGLTSR